MHFDFINNFHANELILPHLPHVSSPHHLQKSNPRDLPLNQRVRKIGITIVDNKERDKKDYYKSKYETASWKWLNTNDVNRYFKEEKSTFIASVIPINKNSPIQPFPFNQTESTESLLKNAEKSLSNRSELATILLRDSRSAIPTS